MNRMKTFLKYLIIFIAFYILSDILISIALANSYKSIEGANIETTNYVAKVNEAKVTSMSGYLDGTIKLKENIENPEKYIQFDFYSKYGNCIGRKYINVSSLQPGEEKHFRMNFEYDNIASYIITPISEVEELSEVQSDFISKGYWAISIVGALIVLYYVL